MDATQATVRQAGPGDADRLARMRYEFRAAEDPPVEDAEAFLERCLPWMRRRLAAGEDRWRCWVAEEDGRIVGHVWVQRVPKVPNPAREAEAHAYLTNTYVEPERRGRGVGTALVEAAVAWCRRQGVDSVILWPTAASRGLYRRSGFDRSEGIYELVPDGAG